MSFSCASKKIISITLTSFLLLVAPFQTYAISLGGSGGGGFNIEGIGAIALSCAGITPASLLDSAFGQGGLFGGKGGGLFGKGKDAGVASSAKKTGSTPSNSSGGQSVPVGDAISQEALAGTSGGYSGGVKSLLSSLASGGDPSIKGTNKATKKLEEQEEKKEKCGDKIARFVALEAMDRITLETVKWINSGFDGSPFYVENPGQFFTDFASQELFGFDATFTTNTGDYPFGQQITKAFYDTFSTAFEANMKNSLDNVLAHGTKEEFEVDFSVGGWVGYTALMEPNNNVLGAYIESSNHMQEKLDGTKESRAIEVRRELNEGGGFLSQRECTSTEGGGSYIQENSPLHLPAGKPFTSVDQIEGTMAYLYITGTSDFDLDGDPQTTDDILSGMGVNTQFHDQILAIANEARLNSQCLHWRNVTPGYQVAEKITATVGLEQDKLALVDELNEDVGLIFDALLNQLLQQGLAYLYEPNQVYTGDPNNNNYNVLWAQNNGLNPGGGQNSISLESAINGFVQDGEPSLGLIQIQYEYIDRLKEMRSLLGPLIQRSYDLDYCIPGPHPSWQVEVANDLADYLYSMTPFEVALDYEDWEYLVVKTDISGTFYQNGIEHLAKNVRKAYLEYLGVWTGVWLNHDDAHAIGPSSLQMFVGEFSEVYLNWANKMNYYYTNSPFPSQRGAAEEFFLNIPNLQNQITIIADEIEATETAIYELGGVLDQYSSVQYSTVARFLIEKEIEYQAFLEANVDTDEDDLTYQWLLNDFFGWHDLFRQIWVFVSNDEVSISDYLAGQGFAAIDEYLDVELYPENTIETLAQEFMDSELQVVEERYLTVNLENLFYGDVIVGYFELSGLYPEIYGDLHDSFSDDYNDLNYTESEDPTPYVAFLENVTDLVGYELKPPADDEIFMEVLDDFTDLLPYISTQDNVGAIEDIIEDILDRSSDDIGGVEYYISECIEEVSMDEDLFVYADNNPTTRYFEYPVLLSDDVLDAFPMPSLSDWGVGEPPEYLVTSHQNHNPPKPVPPWVGSGYLKDGAIPYGIMFGALGDPNEIIEIKLSIPEDPDDPLVLDNSDGTGFWNGQLIRASNNLY